MGKFTSAILRLLEILFAFIVLGLSINAVRWQYYHNSPATNRFACFVGAFGCFASLLGFAAIWIEPIAGMIMTVVDVLATIFFLAGGIALAVGLRGVDCDDGNHTGTWYNSLISGGCTYLWDESNWQCGFFQASDVEHRCHMAKADTAFSFSAFIVSLLAIILAVTSARSTKNKLRSSV